VDLTALDGVARYVHIVAIMVWMGHNWVNFIARPRYLRVLPQDPPEAARSVFIAAAQREHGVFRYASLAVIVTGLFMLWDRQELWDALTLHGAAAVIGIGVWLAVIMTANLWFVLWPHQKKVLAFVPATVEERLRCTRITFLSSRTNTILSIPAVFFMVMGSHAGLAF